MKIVAFIQLPLKGKQRAYFYLGFFTNKQTVIGNRLFSSPVVLKRESIETY